MSMYLILGLLCCLTVIIAILKRTPVEDVWLGEMAQYTFDGIFEYIKNRIELMCQAHYMEGANHESALRSAKKRAELRQALKRCVYGSSLDKAYVKDVLYDILVSNQLDTKAVLTIIPFDYPSRLSPHDMFDILLFKYEQLFGVQAFHQLCIEHQFDQPKKFQSMKNAYVITKEDVIKAYYDKGFMLTGEDKLRILVQRIYQRYKGFSVIDSLRDMAIDGVSGGVSGLSHLDCSKQVDSKDFKGLPMSYDSIWVFYKGKSMHLECLSFGNEEELKRVCQNIYRYNNVGMLSRDVGYKINDMMDGSRVVVVRPDFSESWAFFVRKFHLEHVSLEALVTDINAKLPIELMKYLVKGARITAITGSQGSGKTTLLMGLVKEIYSALTLRVQETAFELHLRRLYPYRNVLSFKETHTISGQMGLDLQKKTDGSVNILGEVATDEVAAWMIQMAQVASLFTLFTHHAKTVSDLVLSLRNSLLKCDVFRNERVAEEQVVKVVNFDIHLVRDYQGRRYIARITEILPLDDIQVYPRAYKDDLCDDRNLAFMDTVSTYFERVTDRKTYYARDIVRYVDGEYFAVESLSQFQISEMYSAMQPEDQKDFLRFLEEFWPKNKEEVYALEANSVV